MPEATQVDRRVSDELEAWFASEADHTLGGLLDVFEKRSFAIAFVVLLGVPALPLPTGGVTHVFEIIAVLLGLELLVGRERIWLPQRWCRLRLQPEGRFLRTLLRVIRALERISRPRLRWVFDHRLSNAVFGLLVVVLSIAAFVAPPFTGLDTLPALGVVLLSLGVLLEDFLVVVLGLVVGAVGIAVEIVVGGAAFRGLSNLF